MTQEEVLRRILQEEVAQVCRVDLDKDQGLSNLALVMSSRPTKDTEVAARRAENKMLDQYVLDLK